jgi:hypothetical protein
VFANWRGFGSAALARRPDAAIKADRREAKKCRSPMEAIAQRYWTETSSSRQNTIEVP